MFEFTKIEREIQNKVLERFEAERERYSMESRARSEAYHGMVGIGVGGAVGIQKYSSTDLRGGLLALKFKKCLKSAFFIMLHW